MKEKLKKISEVEYLIPKEIREEMRVNSKIIATKKIIDAVEEEAVKQLTNVACLPGVVEPVYGMPDIHWGYGLPMGAVGAFDSKEGVISSGCTGFDINCGIRMIKTNLTYEEVKPKLKKLIDTLFKNVPSGVGSKGRLRLSQTELDEVLVKGARWAEENGYATKKDLEHMEEYGCMEGANPDKVSDLAKKRGRPQLGTLGAGNHFLEVQKVDKIFNSEVAEVFGVSSKDQIIIMLHCGSRGLGHQVATDYLKIHGKASKKYNIWLPDPQLVCAPVDSQEGQDYFEAMKCAVNYAFCNRTIMTSWIRESFEEVFGMASEDMEMDTIYDVCHNICKLEELDGRKIYVHRKGSTRSLPEGHELIPRTYRKVGQPVLIAGSMGTASYILVGGENAKNTFYSSCHGAGRVMSRHKAIKSFRGNRIREELADRGIIAKSTTPIVLAEESPDAYKDIDEVVKAVDLAGISKKVVRVVPVGVVKG
ncbi:MAG: RNA-splicing ligase RtcB [Candidatus Aenigmarchaeota archaeon ex4484_56]|nr:MAG: RNA-splicing ligase RtcB [Candidatus Aenigmarchaeota archaeon ex4484_56]